MNQIANAINWKKALPSLLLGFSALVFSAYLSTVNHYAVTVLLLVCAVVLYFYIWLAQADKNWWDVRAVFTAIWLLTIGVSSLRLTDYQKQWEVETWICLAVGYAMFHLGAGYGLYFGERMFHWFKRKGEKQKGRIVFGLRQERLFWICMIVSLIGFICFAINVYIRGYIPFFARTGDTYLAFYSKFYIFSIAATMISGLCYYTLKTQKLSIWKRILLWVCIVYATFLFPTLVVSRGAFLTSALSLTTVIFYLNRKRLILLVVCAAVIVGFYGISTKARGYTEEQLNFFFEPSTIIIGTTPTTPPPTTVETGPTMPTIPTTTGPSTVPTVPSGSTEPTVPPITEIPGGSNQVQFQLSGTAAFIYSYLTVSHDNFNEAVLNLKHYTYGIRQLAPFNVVLRIDAIDNALTHCEYHLVRPHLNTVNLMGDAYYDFGIIGVMILAFVWAFAFGAMQSYYEASKGVFSLLALGNSMTPVTLCFFSTWMSDFSSWMHWGTVLLMFLAAYITVKPNLSDMKSNIT